MRALVFFLSLVLVFVAFLKFYSDPEAAAKDPRSAEAEEATPSKEGRSRFLEPPAEQANRAANTSSAGNQEDDETIPDWLKGVELAPVRDDNELLLAATVVHGTPEEVALRAAAGPQERGILAEAFSRAVAGDPRSAMSLAEELPAGSITAREQGLLQAALEGLANTTRPASAMGEGPMVLAMEMGLLRQHAWVLLEGRSYRPAAIGFSELILAELDAPWPADPATLARFTKGLEKAQKQHRWSSKGEWNSVDMEVMDGDSLVAIRKRYLANYPERSICTGLIQAANQIPKNAVIHKGQTLRIPTDAVRVLVDLAARWCVYLLGNEVVGSWPVGVGRAGEETPPGEYTIGDKIENPPWARIGQPIIPFGDSRNPLGTRWMGWFRAGVKTSYGFHGTSEPESIGLASSDGCIRLLKDDVERLFGILPKDAQVIVRE